MMNFDFILSENAKEERLTPFNISLLEYSNNKCLKAINIKIFRHSLRHSNSATNSITDSNKCLNDVFGNAVRHLISKT